MKNQEKKLKAQSGAEFIAYVSITMFALTILTAAISAQQEQVHNLEGAQQATNTLEMMQENIHTAVTHGEGYQREFNIPRTINNNPYNITLTPGEHNGYIAAEWGRTEQQITIKQTKYNPSQDHKFKSTEGTEIEIKHTETGVEVEQK